MRISMGGKRRREKRSSQEVTIQQEKWNFLSLRPDVAGLDTKRDEEWVSRTGAAPSSIQDQKFRRKRGGTALFHFAWLCGLNKGEVL